MVAFRARVAGCVVVIYAHDHGPPHCHVEGLARRMKVNLLTLEVVRPEGVRLPPRWRRFLELNREDLLDAWERAQQQD